MDCHWEHLNSGLNPTLLGLEDEAKKSNSPGLSQHRTLQIVVLKSNVHQFRKTRNGNWYNPGQLVVSELQIKEIYAFVKVLEIRERIEEIRNDAGDSGVARVERSQSSSRLDILAKDGKVPEREFFWTESVRRDPSCVISEGRLPEIYWESRLMVTTLPVDVPHWTLVQVHGSLKADQSEGAGERASKSLDMTAASSQNDTVRRLIRSSKRKKNEGLECGGRIVGGGTVLV
nr:hypothetical protein Iba_chr12cCG9170 [Ipomoea batatas]